MEENYLITIKGTMEQRGDTDTVELMTRGSLVHKDGAYYIVYKETETTGYEGCTTTVKVAAVAENYLHHYVYMTPALYQKTFGEAPDYSAVFLRTDNTDEEALGRTLLSIDGVTGVSFVSDLQSQVADMMKSLDMVVLVLVISAGMLAFIVLYNLNNISIIERRRELATLKVLGFYDSEVAGYVYRENVWLTCIGMALGMGIGFFLHKFIIRTCEVDMIMFGQNIRFMSYVWSMLLTLLFAVIVNFLMFWKLKKIDMVESLKSIE